MGGSQNRAGFLDTLRMSTLFNEACDLQESKRANEDHHYLEQIPGMYVSTHPGLNLSSRFLSFLCFVSVHLPRKRKPRADTRQPRGSHILGSEPVWAGPVRCLRLDGEALGWGWVHELKRAPSCRPHQRRGQSRLSHLGNISHAESVSASPRPNPKHPRWGTPLPPSLV